MLYCVMNKDAIFYLISVRSNNLILDSVDWVLAVACKENHNIKEKKR